MLVSGYATPEGTERFCERFAKRLPGHFRKVNGLRLSSIGLGTYLGDPSAERDSQYVSAVIRAVEMGTNVIDTAINYRHQRSERSVAHALRSLFEAGTLGRDEVFLATKGGFLAFDGQEPDDVPAYFHEKLVKTGLIRPEEVVAGCHLISPQYLANQIDASRANLGVETIDLYYLHNPEAQLREVSREEFFKRLKAAFVELEKAVADGKIRAYGTATWDAYRVAPQTQGALSLRQVLQAAEEAGGKAHHFRAVQLPLNLAMLEALVAKTQPVDDKLVPFLELARAEGLMVFASASLLQDKLTDGLPEGLQTLFPGVQKDSQRALQFARSAPGITCALVGMGRREHVEENLGTAFVPPLTAEQFWGLFKKGE